MNNEELRELRELIQKNNSGNYSSHIGTSVLISYKWVPVARLMELAQLAVLPGDAEPTAGGVTYGEPVRFGTVRNGAIVEDENGHRFVADAMYLRTPALRQGIRLRDGSYTHYPIDMTVREIHLPAPVASPQEPEPPLDERAWRFIEKMRDYDGWQEAEDLLAERAAATQGTAGG